MNKNIDLMNKMGFLTEKGKEFLSSFKKVLNEVLTAPETKNMSVQDIRTLGGALSKIVGDAVSKSIQEKSQKSAPFSNWDDEKFENYLKEKYGDRWMWQKLANDEMDRAKILADNALKSLEQSQEKNHQNNYPSLKLPDIFFKS